MDISHLEHFPCHKLELCSCDPLLNHGISSYVEVRFIQVFLGLLQSVLISLGVISLVESLLQFFRLLQK